jgi:cellulose biosynthesis protein BcsQ
MGKIVTVSSHTGVTGKATTGAHRAFLAADRGAKTLLVDLDAQGNASDTVRQRRLHPALIRMASVLFDDDGVDKAIFYSAEIVVTADGELRVNFSAQTHRRFAKLLDPRSPP